MFPVRAANRAILPVLGVGEPLGDDALPDGKRWPQRNFQYEEAPAAGPDSYCATNAGECPESNHSSRHTTRLVSFLTSEYRMVHLRRPALHALGFICTTACALGQHRRCLPGAACSTAFAVSFSFAIPTTPPSGGTVRRNPRSDPRLSRGLGRSERQRRGVKCTLGSLRKRA